LERGLASDECNRKKRLFQALWLAKALSPRENLRFHLKRLEQEHETGAGVAAITYSLSVLKEYNAAHESTNIY
jgi:hypothetical protein